MSLSQDDINFFEGAKVEPIIALIREMKKKIVGITVGGDFRFGYNDPDNPRFPDLPEGIITKLYRDMLPSIGIYEENSKAERIGIGQFVDTKGKKKAIRYNSTITFDIWAINSYQREVTSRILSRLFSSFNFGAIGFLEFKESSTRSRGFDLTDRILQFHSHQITNIVRRLLYYNVQYEVIEQEPTIAEPVKMFSINTGTVNADETTSVGSPELPIAILINQYFG